jgi:hypothetical protein
MKPALFARTTAFLIAFLLMAALTLAQEKVPCRHSGWWSGCRSLPVAQTPAKAQDQQANDEVKAEKKAMDQAAKGDEIQIEAKAVQKEADEETEEGDAGTAKAKAKANSATVEVQITIRIGKTERTVKIELPVEDIQAAAAKGKAAKKAKSGGGQDEDETDTQDKSVTVDLPVSPGLKAADEQKAVVVDPGSARIPDPPARQEMNDDWQCLKSTDEVLAKQEMKAAGEQKNLATDEPIKPKTAGEVKTANDGEISFWDIMQMFDDAAAQQINPPVWEKVQIPALPAAPPAWRSELANALSGVQSMLDGLWQDAKTLATAVGKLSAANAEARVSRQPE